MLPPPSQTSDEHIRADVATRVSELAERYAPDNHWFIDTMNRVFELAGDLVRPELADDLMQLIAEGTGDSREADTELRRSAVESYIDLLGSGKPKMPKLLLAIVAWVLGEYGTLCLSPTEVMDTLAGIGRRQDCEDSVRAFVLTALCKVCCAQGGTGGPTAEADAFVSKMLASRNLDLQQRAVEFRTMMACPADLRQAAMPADASCEEVESDSLAALDAFVSQALANGAAPYIDIDLRDDSALSSSLSQPQGDALRYDNYEQPETASGAQRQGQMGGEMFNSSMGGIQPLESLISGPGQGEGGHDQPPPVQDPSKPQLNISGPRKWGRPAPQPQAPPAAPEPVRYAEEPVLVQADPQPYAEQPVASEEFADPAEMSEKQRLAASLFGGGGRAARRQGGGRRGRQQAAPAAVAAPQQQHQQQQPDLLLDMGVSTPAPAQQAQTAPSSVMDELSLLDVSAPVQQHQQPQAQPALDLMGGMGGLGSQPQQPPPMGGLSPMTKPAGQPLGAPSPKPASNDPFKDLLG